MSHGGLVSICNWEGAMLGRRTWHVLHVLQYWAAAVARCAGENATKAQLTGTAC